MKVLVIEDDGLVIESIKGALSDKGELFFSASLVDFFKSKSNPKEFDLALLDLMSASDPSGEKSLELISKLRREAPSCVLLVQSGANDIEIMRTAIKQGANRFVLKEHLLKELPFICEWAAQIKSTRLRVDDLILGNSPEIGDFKERLVKTISQTEDVLIEGESGVGKELCAATFAGGREIPFIAINVASIPNDIFEGELFGYEKGAFSGANSAKPGLFEVANGGILFLDEIQSLPYELQAKLLRVLETRTFRRLGSNQEKQFTGRVLSASNRPLVSLVAAGEFREDLYFRLSASSLFIPPLRNRKGDVLALSQHFLKEFDQRLEKSFEKSATDFLESYDWPGNVRQLRMCVKNIVSNLSIPLIGKSEVESFLSHWEEIKIPVDHQSSDADFTVDWNMSLDENVMNLEKYMLSKVISDVGSVKAREQLNVKKSRFYEKLKTLGLKE